MGRPLDPKSGNEVEIIWPKLEDQARQVTCSCLGWRTPREDVEDCVSEVKLRYMRAQRREAIREPLALVTTMAQRVASDYIDEVVRRRRHFVSQER